MTAREMIVQMAPAIALRQHTATLQGLTSTGNSILSAKAQLDTVYAGADESAPNSPKTPHIQ